MAGGDHHRPRLRRHPRRLVADPAFLVPLAVLRLRPVPALRADRLAVSVHRAALRSTTRSRSASSQDWTWEIPVLLVGSHRASLPPLAVLAVRCRDAGRRAGRPPAPARAIRQRVIRAFAGARGVRRLPCGVHPRAHCMRRSITAPLSSPALARPWRPPSRRPRPRRAPNAHASPPSSVAVSGGRASRPRRAPVARPRRLSPMVPGQTVVVRFYRDGHSVAAAQVPLAPSPAASPRSSRCRSRRARAGRIVVRATHRATPQLGTLKAKRRRARRSCLPRARPGAPRPVVRAPAAPARAARLRRRPAPGVYDARTARAVLAFRKVTGLRADDDRHGDVFRRLAAGGGALPACASRATASTSRPTSRGRCSR